MRRFITLAAIALSTLIAAPVLAAPGGPGNGPNGHRDNSAQTNRYNGPGAKGYNDSGGRAFKPAPIRTQRHQVMTVKELRKAQYLTQSYNRQRASVVRQLNVAQRNLQNLERRRNYRPVAVRAAKAKVIRLQQKLNRLEASYHRSLASFLNRVQLRYFLALS